MKISYTITDDNGGVEVLGDDLRVPGNLAPGNYTLDFIVSNSDGWSQRITQAIKVSDYDPDRYMFFATRNRQPSGAVVTIAAGAEYKAVKLLFGNGSTPKRDFKLHFSGFSMTEGGASPAESQIPNATQNLDSVALIYNGVSYPCSLSASTIAAGALGVWASVLLPVDLAADDIFGVDVIYHGAVGETQIPVYQVQPQRGERVYGASSLSAVQTLAASAGPSNLIETASYWGPDLMVAKGWDGGPVALVANDSIGDQRNDDRLHADARGNQGYLRRWLDIKDPDFGRVPHHMMSVPGAHAEYLMLTTNVPGSSPPSPSIKVWQVLDEAIAFNAGALPWTVVVNQMGQNDLATDLSLTEARVNSMLGRIEARYPEQRIVGLTLLPNTTSTDNWLTRVNQSPRTSAAINGYPAGVKYQYNDYVKAGMGGRLAGSIDAYAPIHDPAYGGTWPAPYFTTTLAEQAGSNGTATYTTVVLNSKPQLGSFLVWGTPSSSNTGHAGSIVSISGIGPYTVTLDRTNTQVAAANSVVWSPNCADQVHPEEYMCSWLAANISQSEKATLVG